MYKSLRAQTLHYFARPHERIPLEPIVSPAAWRGEDVRKESAWRLRLGPAEVAELQAAVSHAQSRMQPLGLLTRADFPLPLLAARMQAWRAELRHGRGFVLIQGVPVTGWSQAQSEIFFWGFGQHLGLPGAQNPQNDLLGHVRDQRTTEDARFYRTAKAIAVHCDAADVVGLLCLLPARTGGLSRIASSVAVYNELLQRRPELVARLFKPMYFDTHGEGGVRAFPVAPCRYAAGELRTFWQSDYYRSAGRHPGIPKLTGEEHELLDAYDAIANDPRFHLDMDLQPGDVQLVSNHTILHARTAFEDWPEPERRRHLLRLWLSMPEQRPARVRWLTRRSLAGLVLTATRELAVARLRA
ncbi:MAG TPA: TauD/TfdA family dioxygenase [Solimonas sp.]|nr:TauD/TfdA family dioxygenase [Solimonas sp.]